MAVSSSGGHWSQLMLLSPAFAGGEVTYVSTVPEAEARFPVSRYRYVPDCNRNSRFGILTTLRVAARIFFEVRPDTVISTGALPGLIMIVLARLTGRRAIWVDSIANSERLSMCGNVSRYLAHKCYVQWPELARLRGASYVGSVL